MNYGQFHFPEVAMSILSLIQLLLIEFVGKLN